MYLQIYALCAVRVIRKYTICIIAGEHKWPSAMRIGNIIKRQPKMVEKR